ncbi:MAG: dihydropteroate synthase-like protein [Acidilobaceae archaeon]
MSLDIRVAVLTSVTAKPMIEAQLKNYKSKGTLEVEVIALPIHSIAGHSTDSLRRLIERDPALLEKLRRFDVVLIPGTVEGDSSILEVSLAKPKVMKGPRSPHLLTSALDLIARGVDLDKVKPLEERTRTDLKRIDFVEAFKLREVSVPLRGPPVLLSSELSHRCPIERLEKEVRRVELEGADIITVGSSYDMSSQELSKRVAVVRESTTKPLLAEAPTIEHAERALDAGADGVVVSVETAKSLLKAKALDKGIAVLVGDRDITTLESIAKALLDEGVTKIALDPVLGVPLFDFSSSLVRYSELKRLGLPLVFSASNVLDVLPADTHGAQALLTMLAVELGISIYSVVDEQGRLAHTTAEAREALRVSSAMYYGHGTLDHSRLFIIKSPTPLSLEKEQLEAQYVDYIEPKWDKRGYVKIAVDHKEKVIIAHYIEYSGKVYGVKGRHAMSLARALIRLVGMDSEHSAYLGYELAKADLALKLSKNYVQDDDVLKVPWEERRS